MPFPSEHAARVRNPDEFIEDSFRRKEIADGIAIIVGKLREGDDSLVVQSYRFDASKFTIEDVEEWLKKHNVEYIELTPASGDERGAVEYRNLQTPVSLDNTTGRPVIVGYAAVWNQESEPFGYYKKSREMIVKGAFRGSLESPRDIKGLFNHDDNYVLGRRANNTLSLAEDDVGLRVEMYPPDTTYSRDIVNLISSGYVTGMSFAFEIKERENIKREDGNNLYILRNVDLFDVSVVTNPAYPATSVVVQYRDGRSLPVNEEEEEENAEELRELERRILMARILSHAGYRMG